MTGRTGHGGDGLLVGIDMGTTRVKALLLAPDGRELGHAERPTPWQQVDGGTCTDPLLLASLGVQVAVEVTGLAEQLGARVAGVGVTGMGEAGVLVDAGNAPLAPVIAWHDPRGDHDRIAADLGKDAFQRGTGMHLDAQPSISKILWLRRRVPGCAAAVRFHSMPEWVVLALGGRSVSELSLASRTGMLGLAEPQPWQPVTDLLGGRLLADLAVAGEPAGTVGGGPGVPGVTPAGGLPAALAGAALTVAGHDHQTASLAVGAARDGALLDSFGTAEALLRCVKAPVDPAAVGRLADRRVSVGWSVVPGHCTVLFGLLTGMTLEQLAPMLGGVDRETRRALGRAALDVAAADLPDGPVLHERDGQTLVGPLAPGLTPAAVWAAAVEQLADRTADAIGLLDAEVGPYRDVVLTGGWVRNPAVLAAKQHRYGSAVRSAPAVNEAGAVGAGFLAGVAAGLLDRPPHDGVPHWQDHHDPLPGSRREEDDL
jgi:sugar (pentulose or hexulose) kinase